MQDAPESNRRRRLAVRKRNPPKADVFEGATETHRPTATVQKDYACELLLRVRRQHEGRGGRSNRRPPDALSKPTLERLTLALLVCQITFSCNNRPKQGLCVDSPSAEVAYGGDIGGADMVAKDLTAARKLTPRQTALVDVMVAEGLNTSQAAKAAGYAEGKAGYVTAAKTLKLPHVQQYMMQRIAEQLGTNAAFAAAKVMKLATGAKSEYVQLEASKDILDRAGFKPIDRAQVQVAGDIRVQIDLG